MNRDNFFPLQILSIDVIMHFILSLTMILSQIDADLCLFMLVDYYWYWFLLKMIDADADSDSDADVDELMS